MEPARTPAEILEHAGWLRALARSLVRDAATADDLVQETLTAAARRPPEQASVRAWLGKVLRNAAAQRFRSDARRVRRERAAARSEVLPSSEELASRMEIQRRMLECVQELAEPYRSTVVLRYYEGLTSAEIARKQGLPGSTVRSHLKRGLDELRRALDRRHGGRRETWSTLLLPWLDVKPETALATASALASGVLTMSTGVKLAFGAALVAVAVIGYEIAGPSAARMEPAPSVAEVAHAAEVVAPDGLARESASGSLDVRARLEPAGATAPTAATPEVAYALTALVVDHQLQPVEGARLWVAGAELDTPPSDDSGVLVATFDLVDFDGTRRIRIARTGFATHEADVEFRRGTSIDLGQVVLEPGGSIAGIVIDAEGLPVAGAAVLSTAADLQSFGPEMARRTGPDPWQPQLPARSDAGGRFVLPGLPVGYRSVWAQAGETLWSVSEPVEVRAGEEITGLVLRLDRAEAADYLAGVVLDPAGAPVPDCPVRCNYEDALNYLPRMATTDEHGRFRLLALREDKHDVIVSHPEGRWADVSVLDVAPGPELVLRFVETRWIRLEIVDARGEPLQEASAHALVSTERSTRLVGQGESTEAPGILRLHEPSEPFTLQASAAGCAETTLGPYAPGSLPDVMRIELEAIPGIHGSVVAQGEPVGGARVELFLLTLSLQDRFEAIHYAGFPVFVNPWPEETVETGADGRFSFRAPEERGYLVRAEHDGFAPAEWRLPDFDPRVGAAGLELALSAGGAIEGELIPPDGGIATGTTIAISRGDARHRVARVGEDGHFLFEHLTPGRWNVEALERTLDGSPGSRHSLVSERPELPWVCEVFEGETTFYDVDLRSVPECTVSGELIVDGAPAASWWVRLDAGPGRGTASAEVPQSLVGADGRFELKTPDEGAYTLSLVAVQAEVPVVIQAPLELRHGPQDWALELETAPVVVENLGTPELRLLVWEGADGVACRLPLQPDDDGVASVPLFPTGMIRVATNPTGPRRWETMQTLASAAHLKGATTRLVLP